MNPIKYIVEKFQVWRRRPFKTALCRAYSDSLINSYQMHELAARMDAPHKEHVKPKGGYAFAARQGTVACLLIAFLAMSVFTGCATNPSKSHVVRAVATGTKFGVTQNPTTGIYELGVQRVQTEIITIPVFSQTNAQGVVVLTMPDVVSRYEVSTHSAVFGNAALTSTMATGSNAVGTEIGGKTPPINAGVGTGSNLTPLSH